MMSQTSSLLSCAARACEKIPKTFANGVGVFNLLLLTFLVGLLVCLFIDAGLSNATERAWISAASAAVEAPV